MMKNLICPISTQRVDENVVRTVALMVAVLTGLYVYSGNLYLMLLLLVDFYLRAFTELPYSPLRWLAAQIVRRLGLAGASIDKAPKIFAARVGFLFAVAILLLAFVSPVISALLSLVLVAFALLEALFNICVGCLVYSYVIFPLFNP
jgi:hypothetical protein